VINLEELGITKEDLQERVIDRMCSQLLEEQGYDEDGEPTGRYASRLQQTLKDRIQRHVDATISAMAEKHVLPRISEYVERLCLQETNKYGEKVGKPLTFIEYLTTRADHYMREEVNYDGKAKADNNYSWSAYGTRVAYMVNKHLNLSIQTAMKDAVSEFNKTLVGGIEGAVKVALKDALSNLKTTVTTGR